MPDAIRIGEEGRVELHPDQGAPQQVHVARARAAQCVHILKGRRRTNGEPGGRQALVNYTLSQSSSSEMSAVKASRTRLR